MHPTDAAAIGFDVDAILEASDLDAQLDAMIADLDRKRDALLGVSTTDNPNTRSDAPPLTFDAIRELQREMSAKAGGVERIIAEWPGCPHGEALKWETRRILLLGPGMLDALARAAERSDPLTRVDPKAQWSILGRTVERWGERDDHEELLRAFVHELTRAVDG